MHVEMGEISENEPVRPKITDSKGILQQNRDFLDFFWDIAKPEQDTRLKAVENLVKYLKKSGGTDELDYTLKRLVAGLAHNREPSRPGFSLALGQVLTVFEEIPLQTVLDEIKEKHNLQKVKKKLIRNALFGNYFGVLALSQSNRLFKEPQVVLGCIQLLQSLSERRDHLKDLPCKTMADILSETPEDVFEEVLIGTLQTDLASAFKTPEQLQLLLVAMQRFPQFHKPKKLKKLLGTTTIITNKTISELTDVLKMAALSAKKERLLPPVALDLLKQSLQEDSFQLFWSKAIVDGMFKEQPGPTHYLGYRLLGSALPLLTLDQLKEVLSGEVMKHYGEHLMSAQNLNRFRLAPEMDTYVADFLKSCADPEKQLAVILGFSKLTNQGYPVIPSVWKVVQYLQPVALQQYVDWLKTMFLQPQLENCVDFSSRRQKTKQEEKPQEDSVLRLRKWIIARLTSIIENQQVEKDEDLVKDVARFVFFHAFFKTKKITSDIPETKGKLSVPLENQTRIIAVNSFFGLLQHLYNIPLHSDKIEVPARSQRRSLGLMADGTMWIHWLVRYAQVLLSQPKYVLSAQPLNPEQKKAWDSMIESVAELEKKAKKGPTPEINAFLQLFLLVGMQLFKAPEEVLDIMKDLQNCIEKAEEKKSKKSKKKQKVKEEEDDEPQWVEVVVDILLSLLSQPSRHIRQVCKNVFSSICPHVTATALTAILDVLDPNKDEEESALVVTDDNYDKANKKAADKQDVEIEEEWESAESESDSEQDDEDEDMEEDTEVDQNFRLEMMKVLQKQNALAIEDDGSDAEDLDDEAMMKLDNSLSILFADQKKKTQAKKDEKAKLLKEKSMVREYKIKVLDLVEIFVTKQAGSPLILGVVEPFLTIIENGMSSESGQQEQDFLRKAADIFRNQLCRSKVYCRTAGDRQEELHDLVEKLMTKATRQADSSLSLYFFSASLYLVKVLRGSVPAAETEEEHGGSVPAAETEEEKARDTPASEDLRFMGKVDVERVSAIFREAMCSFMNKRNSPLTGQMFNDLFTRFPVLCVNLVDIAVQHITSGIRDHQQSQACVLVLRALQSREVQQLLAGTPWADLCQKTVNQLAATLDKLGSSESKAVQEKVIKALELCQFLTKHIHRQKLSLDLEPLRIALQSLTEVFTFRKTGHLEDIYWTVMKHFGVIKPKVEKIKKATKEEEQQNIPKKVKGFLPETKKRKNRKKKKVMLEGATNVSANFNTEKMEGDKEQTKKKNDKKKLKRKSEDGGTPAQPSLSKKTRTSSESMPAKKKKKKQGGNE